MIKVFRNIRKNIFSNNSNLEPASQFTRYVLYAFGEILLVVIGILLALQVNNWNESRKLRNEEKVILNALQDEISENQQVLDNAILRAERVLNTSHSILKYTGPGNPELTKVESDSLMRVMTARITAEVSHSILNDLMVTGRIHLIRNDTLKQQLTSWISMFNDEILEEQGYIIHFTQNQIIPFLVDNYSFATEELKSRTGFESNFRIDHRKIYQSVEFENLVINKEINYTGLVNSYQRVIEYNDQLLLAINRELKY